MRLIQLGSKSLLATTVLALSACGGSGGSSNSAPTFAQESFAYTLAEDTPFTGQLSASDSDGDRLAYRVQQSPQNGILSVTAEGAFTYTPSADVNGSDSAVVVVSDNSAEAQATLNFTVTAENDLPQIGLATITVDSLGELQGQVVATDVDNDDDSLTFTLVSQSASGNLTFNPDGSFSATSAGGSFRVAVSDGVGAAVEGDINLSPSYVTSDDRRKFYYASPQSHLRQVESLIVDDGNEDAFKITDVTKSDEAYEQLAIGYALAGFADRARQIIDNDIASLRIKARAYRQSGVALDSIGETPTANELRSLSSARYNEYLALQGLENISSELATAYIGLANDYRRAGEHEAADTFLNSIETLAAELGGPELLATSAHRSFIRVIQGFANDSVFAYVNDPEGNNLADALAAVDRFAAMAQTAGYSERSGARYELYKPLYMQEVTTLYYLLSLPAGDQSAVTKAKDMLARTLAFYTNAHYDQEHRFDVDANAATTLLRYSTALDRLSGLYAALYPQAITVDENGVVNGNIAINLLRDERNRADSSISVAYRYTLAYWTFARTASDADIKPLLVPISDYHSKTYTASSAPDRHWDVLVEYLSSAENTQNITLHRLLTYAGREQQARDVLTAALTLTESDDYIAANTTSIADSIGSSGCLRVAQLLGENAGQAEQISATARCQVLADNTFLPAEGHVVNTGRAVSAAQYMMVGWNRVQDAAKAKAVADRIVPEIAQITVDDDDSLEDYLQAHFDIANTLATLGSLEDGQTVMAQALSKANEVLADTSLTQELQVDNVDVILGTLDEVMEAEMTERYLELYAYVHAVRYQAGIHDAYASTIAAEKTAIANVLQNVDQLAASFADAARKNVLEDLIEHYSNLGNYQQAQSLMLNDLIAEAEHDDILVAISSVQGSQDDFPGSDVANVDTDLDGLPNFYLAGVTQQAIDTSRLVLDSDDDADGVINTEDIAPLIAN